MSPDDWLWFGQPGHFICAERCNYHLHTHVGTYCISTVGEYREKPGGELQDLGGLAPNQPRGSMLYETMVFEIGDDGGPLDWGGIDMARYGTRKDAHQGHLNFCLAAEKGLVGYARD